MEVKDAVSKLESSAVFKEYRKTQPKSYLANAFTMIEPNKNAEEWQLGYYTEKNDKIVTFGVGKEIIKNPESEVFRKDGVVSSLDLSKIKVDVNTAMQKAILLQRTKYPADMPMKQIILLQHFENHHIYNITFVTQTFKTLNIKVSSQDGRIVSDSLNSLFDFHDKNA